MTISTVFDEIKKQSNLIRILVIFLILAVGIHLFQIGWQILGNFSDIILVIVSAWLLSFILEPVVEAINRFTRLPRIWSTLITYSLIVLIFAGFIFLLIPTVTNQIQTLTKVVPSFLETAPKYITNISGSLTGYLNNSLSIIAGVAQFFFYVILVLIISFYFIIDKEKIDQELFDITPKKWHENLKFIKTVVNNIFASFLRVQLIFGIISGLSTWLVLRILGIDFAATAGLLAGLFAIIPLVGPILAIIPPVFVALLIAPSTALLVFLILLVIQQVIFNIIGPKLLGRSFKVHPIIILVSFLVGSKVAGGVGAIFAIPVLGIMVILIKRLSRYFLKPHE
ncbi:MAG: AI-2E family transporter [Candidatus Levybacteria bacterium]|nr:AI-2E family transporter [Candidatus Levybacteria bacterium]